MLQAEWSRDRVPMRWTIFLNYLSFKSWLWVPIPCSLVEERTAPIFEVQDVSTLKLEVECSSEIAVPAYYSYTTRVIPQRNDRLLNNNGVSHEPRNKCHFTCTGVDKIMETLRPGAHQGNW
jgi:hypothetical protein